MDIVDLLIKRGADVNLDDGSRALPLVHAVWHTQEPMVRRLVAEGAEVPGWLVNQAKEWSRGLEAIIGFLEDTRAKRAR